MHVLYEEDGSYKAATVLADQNTAFSASSRPTRWIPSVPTE